MQKTRASQGLATSFIYSSISELSIGFLFILLILSARFLGDANFGVFSFALAYVSLFGFIADGGLRYIYTRAVSRQPELAEQYLGNILSLLVLFSALGFGLIVLILQVMNRPPEVRLAVYMMGAAEMLRYVIYLFRYVFRTANRFELETVVVVMERLLLMVLGLGVLIAGYGVVELAGVFLGVRLLGVAVNLWLTRRVLFRPAFMFEYKLWPQLVRQGVPFVLYGAVVLLLFRIDSVLITLIRGDAETGWYSAAYRLLDGAYLFPLILSAILYPRLSRLHKDRPALVRMFSRGIRYVFMLAVPLAVFSIVLAEPVILLVYGEDFTNAIRALQVLMLGLTFIFMQELYGSFLGAIDKQRVAFYIAAVVLALNVGLNLILIPQHGYIGAAIATCMAQLTFVLITAAYLHYLRYPIPYLKLALRPLLAAALSGALIYALDLPLLLAAMVAGGSYVVLISLMGIWEQDEIETSIKLMRRVNHLMAGLNLPGRHTPGDLR